MGSTVWPRHFRERVAIDFCIPVGTQTQTRVYQVYTCMRLRVMIIVEWLECYAVWNGMIDYDICMSPSVPCNASSPACTASLAACLAAPTMPPLPFIIGALLAQPMVSCVCGVAMGWCRYMNTYPIHAGAAGSMCDCVGVCWCCVYVILLFTGCPSVCSPIIGHRHSEDTESTTRQKSIQPQLKPTPTKITMWRFLDNIPHARKMKQWICSVDRILEWRTLNWPTAMSAPHAQAGRRTKTMARSTQ